MGGADIAVARDTSALNTNPAGLTQIHGQAFDGFGSVLRTFDLSHKDSFGNDKHADNKYTFLGGGGYAASLDSVPCTAGVGLFSQGGAGGVVQKYQHRIRQPRRHEFAVRYGQNQPRNRLPDQ